VKATLQDVEGYIKRLHRPTLKRGTHRKARENWVGKRRSGKGDDIGEQREKLRGKKDILIYLPGREDWGKKNRRLLRPYGK